METRSPDKLRAAQRRSGVQEKDAKHNLVRPPQAGASLSWAPDRRSGFAVACPGHDYAAADLPIAAFTRGITCSAISCIERLASAGSTQSMPA
jgi:hypothetical protein